MISVVLYGRNDSYGYNLHKRAVLSINCIAEVLDHPDDEILFVDYNTPDDLPTFVDAIADLLTERAQRITRTLRVRPHHHAAFASKTHLKALEGPARNAAIRRSNPTNRWILSTNTDMIFVPRSDRSLSKIAETLADGFYHSARFEIPEILWETLKRTDPAACIDTVRRWGTRLQLQEVVYGTPVTLFDGPGDFQLILRSDAFRVYGFDERMLLGWHLDTNIARRLSLLRGEPVKSLLDQVLTFHCDHNRETTPMHQHGAVQNDWSRFVDRVVSAELPEQQTSWGFAGETLEESHPTENQRVIEALERLVPPMERPFYVTGIEPQSYFDLRYDPEHVLPYIANIIAAFPRTWSVGYAGCRNKTFRAFLALWKTFGFSGNILVDSQTAQKVLSIESDDAVTVLSETQLHERADAFVFEAGAAQDDAESRPTGARARPEDGIKPLSQEDFMRIRLVHRAYIRTVEAERRSNRPARRFLLINMQHNPCSAWVDSFVGASWTPTGTRVRHGFVLPDPAEKPPVTPSAWFLAQLPAQWRPHRSVVDGIVQTIAGSRYLELSDYSIELAEIVRILSLPDAATMLQVPAAALAIFIQNVEQLRPSRHARAHGLPVVDALARRHGLCRIAAVEDFDDPEWSKFALRVGGVATRSLQARKERSAWEASHTIFVLEKLGALDGTTMFLQHPQDKPVVAQTISGAMLDWSAGFCISDATQGIAAQSPFDAIVVSPRSAVVAGAKHVPAVLRAIDQCLKIGGTCIVLLDLLLQGESESNVALGQLQSGLFDETLPQRVAWRAMGPLDLSLSAQTIDCSRTSAQDPPYLERIVRRQPDGSLVTSCALVYQKTGTTTAEAWERFYGDVLNKPQTTAVL